MRSVVITGASTGIGWASAKMLLDRGFRVFGSVRKQADADRLKGEFGANFTPLIFDVTDEAAVLAAAREVRGALNGETLTGLVNNAGIAVSGPVLELAADEFRRQMEVNFIGPIIATQAFGPLLGSDPALKGPKGRIVMISSVAGKNGNPMTSAYSASKHAIEGLSESLRRELMLFGIDVIIIAPGAVKTPIWSKAEEVDISPYKKLAVSPGAGEDPHRDAGHGRGRIAGRDDCREGVRGIDAAESQGALHDGAGSDAAVDSGGAAQARPRQNHRQTARADAAGVSMMLRLAVGLAAVLVLGSAVHAGDQGEPERSCDGNTFQMVECLKAKTAQWDKRLNVAYQKAVQDAQPAQRDLLRVAQRLWIQYRDANCLYYGLGEGTIARLDAGECMRSMTEARAREFEGLGRQ